MLIGCGTAIFKHKPGTTYGEIFVDPPRVTGRDQPIFAATNLNQAFKEVQTAGKKRIPIQLMYSNAVHGAEGPIAEPHA